jgi:hypothetical protein
MMLPSDKTVHGVISREEAARAIYVDFEGFKDKSPCLIGILVEGALEQVVLDRRLFAAAVASRCRQASIEAVAGELMTRCRSEGRRLVGYSQHERRMFWQHAGIDFIEEYRDARMIANRWWNKCRKGVVRVDNTLKSYLEAIGYPMPASLGTGNTTARLQAVIEMLERRLRYPDLTPCVQAKWRDLLAYNRHDCRGMKKLISIAVWGLDSARLQRRPLVLGCVNIARHVSPAGT